MENNHLLTDAQLEKLEQQTPVKRPSPLKGPSMWKIISAFLVGLVIFSVFGHWRSTINGPSGTDVASRLQSQELRFGRPLTRLSSLPQDLIPTKDNNRRLVIIGDTHGCSEELEKLLKKVKFDQDSDHLILTGDMINKGPSSKGVVRLAQSLGATCVRGNHEDNMLAALASNGYAGIVEDDQEIANAQADPIQKALKSSKIPDGLSRSDVDWIAACPLILDLGHLPAFPHAVATVVVHAGLVPGIPLLKQDPFAVMHMRSISKRHRAPKFTPEEGRDAGVPWWKVWNREQELLHKQAADAEWEDVHEDASGSASDASHHGKGKHGKHGPHGTHGAATAVVYGHDSRTGLNTRTWSMGLDSGCVGGGRLSALVVDGAGTTVHDVGCPGYR